MNRPRTSYESFSITPASKRRALEIIAQIEPDHPNVKTIAIAGESGSGKSTTAVSLLQAYQEKGRQAMILHLDNYFKDIPEVNEVKRRKSISEVGLDEIDLQSLQAHVRAFSGGAEEIDIPILSADRSAFFLTKTDLKGIEMLIIEGTYVFALEGIEVKIFLDFNYEKSRARRISRGRDIVDEFSEEVLRKEHALISPYASQADILFDEEGRMLTK